MEQAKVGKYECIKCDFTTDYDIELNRFEIDMGLGVCNNCIEKLKQAKVTMPLPNFIDRTRKLGTPEQNIKLDERLALWDKQNPKVSTPKLEVKVESKPKESELKKSLNYLTRKMGQSIYRPESITYDSVKDIFWNFYREIIYREKGYWIEAKKLEPVTVEFLKNYLHWIIGSDEGKFDPRKSIYIWGQLGVGKSTIAECGHFLMDYISNRTKWRSRRYGFVSMDELFLETYTTSSLESIGKLASGSWCLDELRERHLKYKHYGNEFYMISDILTARHNLWKRQGLNTIITSNVPPPRLKEILQDDRLMDRIKQQYETYELVGTNKRHLTNDQN